MRKAPAKRNKEEKDDTTSYGGMTQECILDLKDDIARLHDQMKNGFDSCSGAQSDLTQVGIEEL